MRKIAVMRKDECVWIRDYEDTQPDKPAAEIHLTVEQAKGVAAHLILAEQENDYTATID